MIQPSLRQESHKPKWSHRFYITIHHWKQDGIVIQGWAVKNWERQVEYKSTVLAAVEDECARLNRADL